MLERSLFISCKYGRKEIFLGEERKTTPNIVLKHLHLTMIIISYKTSQKYNKSCLDSIFKSMKTKYIHIINVR